MTRIMIDGRNLDLEKGTGVATYARNLSYALHEGGHHVDVLYGTRAAPGSSTLMKEIGFFDSNAGTPHRFLAAIRQMRDAAQAPFGYYATCVPTTGLVVLNGFRSRLPYYDRLLNVPSLFSKAQVSFRMFNSFQRVTVPNRPDIAHWTYPLPLKVPGAANIYTLHDLVPLRLPFTTLDNKRHYFKLVKRIAREADHIITVSEASKADIVRLLGVQESRVTNTYQAVTIPEKYLNKPEEEVDREIHGTFGLDPKGYFLFFGSIEPKKNIGRLIEGYLASGVDAPLVIVGAQAWKSEQELKLLYDDHIRSLVQVGQETRVKRRVIQLSYAPFPLLVSLIRAAKAVCFPSLYEGFGLPVLEAMLLGTPVITSNTSSIPEVAGDAAISVDPYDSRAIAQAIRLVDSDRDLRNELIARGKIQVQNFSQERYVQRLNVMYSKLH